MSGERWTFPGIKWVWGFNDNRAKGLPYIGGIIILNEPRTGEVLAVMDGSYITDVRTGASAGVAAKYLARKDASVAAVIGAGAQGRMVARALKEACSLTELRIADLYPEAASTYAKEMGEELGLSVRPCKSNEEACVGADIIVTCTTAHAVLVRREWVKKGCTIVSLGSFPELDERIPEECDMLVVDSWAQNSHRGELKILVHDGKIKDIDIYGELPEIAAGKKPGRQTDEQIICACIIGMGSTDIGTRRGFVPEDIFQGRLGSYLFPEEKLEQ